MTLLNTITPSAEQWDAFVTQQPDAHVLQLSAWGELKRQFGWQVERVALVKGEDSTIVAGAQILIKRLPFGVGHWAYLPMGPYVTDDSHWELLWDAVKRRVVDMRGVAFLKWEHGLYLNDTPPQPEQWGFRDSPQTIQPPRTILLNIEDDEESILARMNQGTRRKIRKSLKNDVQYSEGSGADVYRFAQMMHTTGQRNEFGVHDERYYQFAYDLFVPDYASLILAEHEGDTLAGIMVFAVGDTAWYLYGASSNEKRNLMASYGVQWKAIQWAKARGCRYYDLWGVPDADSHTLEAEFKNRSDGLWGVYGFKRGWGGEALRSNGTFDRIYNPFIYAGYRTALLVRGV